MHGICKHTGPQQFGDYCFSFLTKALSSLKMLQPVCNLDNPRDGEFDWTTLFASQIEPSKLPLNLRSGRRIFEDSFRPSSTLNALNELRRFEVHRPIVVDDVWAGSYKEERGKMPSMDIVEYMYTWRTDVTFISANQSNI